MSEEEKEDEKEKGEGLARRSRRGSRGLPESADDWFFSPFREIDSVFEDLDKTLNRFFGRPQRFRGGSERLSGRSPVTDLRDLGDKYQVEAELPGLDKDDVEIELRDDNIVIDGEKTEKREEEGEDYLRRERGYKSFYRQLPLPSEVEPEDIAASLENGILTIDLPKKEPEKKESKQIEIE